MGKVKIPVRFKKELLKRFDAKNAVPIIIDSKPWFRIDVKCPICPTVEDMCEGCPICQGNKRYTCTMIVEAWLGVNSLCWSFEFAVGRILWPKRYDGKAREQLEVIHKKLLTSVEWIGRMKDENI